MELGNRKRGLLDGAKKHWFLVNKLTGNKEIYFQQELEEELSLFENIIHRLTTEICITK